MQLLIYITFSNTFLSLQKLIIIFCCKKYETENYLTYPDALFKHLILNKNKYIRGKQMQYKRNEMKWSLTFYKKFELFLQVIITVMNFLTYMFTS